MKEIYLEPKHRRSWRHYRKIYTQHFPEDNLTMVKRGFRLFRSGWTPYSMTLNHVLSSRERLHELFFKLSENARIHFTNQMLKGVLSPAGVEMMLEALGETGDFDIPVDSDLFSVYYLPVTQIEAIVSSERVRNDRTFQHRVQRTFQESIFTTNHLILCGTVTMTLLSTVYGEDKCLEIVQHFTDDNQDLTVCNIPKIVKEWEKLKNLPASWIAATHSFDKIVSDPEWNIVAAGRTSF